MSIRLRNIHGEHGLVGLTGDCVTGPDPAWHEHIKEADDVQISLLLNEQVDISPQATWQADAKSTSVRKRRTKKPNNSNTAFFLILT
jgi:hypothetical protein